MRDRRCLRQRARLRAEAEERATAASRCGSRSITAGPALRWRIALVHERRVAWKGSAKTTAAWRLGSAEGPRVLADVGCQRDGCAGRRPTSSLGSSWLKTSTRSGSNLRAAEPLDLGNRVVDRPGRLVGPVVRERVEGVGERDDAAGERDVGAASARPGSRCRPTIRGACSAISSASWRISLLLPARMAAPTTGWLLTCSHSSSVSGPFLSRMVSERASLPRSWSGAASRISSTHSRVLP